MPLAAPGRQRPGGRLSDVSERAGEPFRPLHLGRGLAVGDLDNDGRIDAVVLAQNEPLDLSAQLTDKSRAISSRFSLEGTRSNRDARRGAGRDRRGRPPPGRRADSAAAAINPRATRGCISGSARRGVVESIEIRWPSGQVDRHRGLKADREYLVREGDSVVALVPRRGPSSRVPIGTGPRVREVLRDHHAFASGVRGRVRRCCLRDGHPPKPPLRNSDFSGLIDY